VTTIYLGGLPADVDEAQVRDLFAPFGDVAAVTVVREPETGAPRGFGFVEMPADAAAAAIAELDGLDWRGGMLRVNEARDRGARPPRRRW